MFVYCSVFFCGVVGCYGKGAEGVCGQVVARSFIGVAVSVEPIEFLSVVGVRVVDARLEAGAL